MFLPLIHFLPDATPIPCLVKEVPSQANGLVSPDLLTVTYNLLEGIVWVSRGNERPPFRIPAELGASWNVRSREQQL